MTRVLVIDPGMSTGIVLAEYDEVTPFKIIGQWQLMDGGLPQFKGWVESGSVDRWSGMQVVCEKFSPLPRVFKLVELEPIRIEGYVEGGVVRPELGMTLKWQTPGAMGIAGTHNGGATAAQRTAANKKAADEMLKRLGLWRTGKKDFGTKDANDANAAMKHLIAYMRGIGHGPSLQVITSV